MSDDAIKWVFKFDLEVTLGVEQLCGDALAGSRFDVEGARIVTDSRKALQAEYGFLRALGSNVGWPPAGFCRFDGLARGSQMPIKLRVAIAGRIVFWGNIRDTCWLRQVVLNVRGEHYASSRLDRGRLGLFGRPVGALFGSIEALTSPWACRPDAFWICR
ncbi:hypothetical protein Nepgr_016220 [Nepenthes gracilis]|uniref:Uncharacterized protein n=1 Tax=Nepenthes gracilis TaxID=150966 RepID=A0AAD3SPE0_NEPGR|nr:hypothetical protein Nepgr_016220 [Nepenthes gracilis]